MRNDIRVSIGYSNLRTRCLTPLPLDSYLKVPGSERYPPLNLPPKSCVSAFFPSSGMSTLVFINSASSYFQIHPLSIHSRPAAGSEIGSTAEKWQSVDTKNDYMWASKSSKDEGVSRVLLAWRRCERIPNCPFGSPHLLQFNSATRLAAISIQI
jgi:hypothetical protein